ncbi:hypothetical protein MPSEU_000057000 [Mayamaea pseudoterrestris]|nr:hypothetical protein MPSEU_000057000 [Mayamaea pseudoterrestris]
MARDNTAVTNDDAEGWPHTWLHKAFGSCQEDPRGSVHRAWGVCLIFILLYFVVSVIEMINVQSNGGSMALVVGSVWTGIMHLLLGVVGTFVLKRFPTAFSIGFFLGTIMVILNQDLIVFGTFHAYGYGKQRTNRMFANVALTLFGVLSVFSLMLYHFKRTIIVAPIDAKGFGRSAQKRSVSPSSDYQAHEGP